ncbi:thiol:disulfide interchange protein DsbA/DsbL [Acinetobacter seifertii]|uniref:Thiol:disulfide interchange protein n=2 Tax=Acinetobacter seifertii TaxID=1530123 RepID=A0A7H2VAX3_9GAMM|nr:thiol:disulfide interchange protein DsbA/DsbL [Acinetobacter seifertii]
MTLGFYKVFFGICFGIFSMNTYSNSSTGSVFIPGKDYYILKNPSKINDGNIKVEEFFWYGCHYCFLLEKPLQSWLKTIPKDVRFERIPAAVNPVWESGARTYYTSEILNVRKKSHLELYKAIHIDKEKIFNQESAATFFTRYDISKKKFNDTYNSFAVTNMIARSNNLMKNYALTGVPAFVINGKYIVKGGDQRAIQVVDYLIRNERKLK